MINAGHPDVAASLGRVSIVWVAGPEVPFTIDNHSYFTVSWRKPMCAACNRLIGKVHADINLTPQLKLDDGIDVSQYQLAVVVGR
jgi:hypothetical protein